MITKKNFVKRILPKYNARCNVFDYKLADDLKKRFDIGGYQYKMLALLSSKFENVLYLDSDNFPTRNVDYLFESDLYKENNLLLWPDAWARTTNPKYYEIAGVPVKENKLRYSKYDENKLAVKTNLSHCQNTHSKTLGIMILKVHFLIYFRNWNVHGQQK